VADFDLKALYDALDQRRAALDMTWAAATRAINRHTTEGHPIATSTIAGLRTRAVAEGDGVLQMLLWLDRTPESFVPGVVEADAERYQLRRVAEPQVLRWDTKALYAAMDEHRRARGLTWKHVAREVGGFTPAMLTALAKGGRAGFPGVMRLVRWLDQPASSFTRISAR
jgi:hypothetical protein